MIRSIHLRGSACALPLTHDVHHGLNGIGVKSCFGFSNSEGSHGVGIGSARARQVCCERQLDRQQLAARLRHRLGQTTWILRVL